MSEVIVWQRHLRSLKLCAGGSRNWFAAYKLDWRKFLAEGISSVELEKLNDPFAEQAIAAARKEQG
ncbi:MAG: hypothetical protein ACRYGR_01605 [Janthinobacterium lividum]